MTTISDKRALYHFWVKLPGGKRARRYCIATPDGNYIGPFWSRKEATMHAAGGWTLGSLASANVHAFCTPGATFVGYVEWCRG